jgi:hypothetical protein
MFPLLIAMLAQYALADGGGCSRFRDGNTCITVKGNGLNVNSVLGYFTKRTPLCNWRYDIAYVHEITNDTYMTVTGSTKRGCHLRGYLPVTYTPYLNIRPSKVCARLYENNGSYVDAACVHVFQ